MTSITGTFGILAGVAVSVVALGMIVLNSSYAGPLDVQQVFAWSLVFLVGIFLFGWGLGKRASSY